MISRLCQTIPHYFDQNSRKCVYNAPCECIPVKYGDFLIEKPNNAEPIPQVEEYIKWSGITLKYYKIRVTSKKKFKEIVCSYRM